MSLSHTRAASAPFVAGLIAGVIGTLGLTVVVYALTGQTFDELKEQGKQYIALIEAFRDEHGEYPVYLKHAKIFPKRTRYGNWQYSLDGDSQQYELSIGDYEGWDPFVTTWYSESRQWHLDT